MKTANFETDLHIPQEASKFMKLREKGDKVKFRIASTPHYETIHFLDGDTRAMCAKYNSDDKDTPCAYCADYARAIQDGDETTAKQIKPVTNFYYPILNLDSNTPALFQFTAKSIHYGIKRYADAGVDVFACDWLVERTEEKGNYYNILRLGEKPLTDAQKEALEAAKSLPVKGSESSSVEKEVAKVEKVEDDFIAGLEKDKQKLEKSLEDTAIDTFGGK